MQAARPIAVGVDGSKAALMAAEWAIAEAVSHEVPLRLVQVIGDGDDHDGREREYAEEALRLASAAVHACGKPVTAIHCAGVDTPCCTRRNTRP